VDRAKKRGFWRKPVCHNPLPRGGTCIETEIGNHTFQATGITAYLKNGGALEKAGAMAKLSASQFEFDV
jgi:hypothetical protein